MSKQHSVSSVSVRTFGTTILLAVIGLASSIITARFLGPEARGMFAAAILVGTLAASLSQFGLGASLVYHLATRRPLNALRFGGSSLFVVLASSVAISIILTPQLADGRMTPFLTGVTVYGLLSAYFQSLWQAAQAESSLKQFNLQRLIMAVGNIILLLGCVLVLARGSWQALLYSQSLVLIVVCTVGTLKIAPQLQVVARRDVPRVTGLEYMKYAVFTYGGAVLWLLQTNSDKLYLAAQANVASFGIYSVAYMVSRLLGSAQEAISSALFARYVGSSEDDIGRAVGKAFRFTFLPVILVAALIGVLCPLLVPLAYGKEFRSMSPLLIILMFESVVAGSSRILAQRFVAAGRSGLVFARQLISLVPLFIMFPILGKFQEPSIVLAFAMLAAATVGLILTMAMIRFICHEQWPRAVPTFGEVTDFVQGVVGRSRN